MIFTRKGGVIKAAKLPEYFVFYILIQIIYVSIMKVKRPPSDIGKLRNFRNRNVVDAFSLKKA